MIYVIYNIADITNVDFSQVYETNENTLRLSVDGTKTVLKFTGDTPDFLVGLQQYTHSEILEVMETSEWLTNDE
jgi:hypothetical protein